MLIHRWDVGRGEEWRDFVVAQAFGHLIAAGRNRELPVVVPTQFLLQGDEVLFHLATPNPMWSALEENQRVILAVAGDWTFIPSNWKAVGDEDPARGIPTTYYAAIQLIGTARIVDEPAAIADILRAQLADLQPEVAVVDPAEHASRLRAIRGIRIAVDEVRSKFKYGGNVDAAHRDAVVARLRDRDAPGDRAALAHLVNR